MRFATSAVLGVGLGSLALFLSAYPSPAAEPSSDFLAEKITVARIHDLGLRIEEFGLENEGEVPASLGVLRERFGLPPERLQDGWGHDLYFFTTGSRCLILSFGRNGTPDPQVSVAGGSVPYRDHDADIVWISGEWAQTPFGIGR